MGSPTLPNAQPHYRKPRGRFPVPASILTIIGIVLFVQFTIFPRLVKEPSPSALKLSQYQLARLDADLQKCTELNTPPIRYEIPLSSRANPRWNPISGQKETVILQNATLFDGESFVGAVDIKFRKGIVVSISSTASHISDSRDAIVIDLEGKYVTPGLIDMHSHHLVGAWPGLRVSSDVNEINPATGPLTPFVRSKDGMKTDDLATVIIASGGITSSLILPGSANIMGGEGFMVKNVLLSGPHREEVVEEILLEHGIPESDRRRYMKMACGENPKRVYDHTRMGNAYIFRHHMERAKELVEKQDAWCISAAAARESGDADSIAALVAPSSTTPKGGLPEELELGSSVAMLRGKIGINTHCYEPEDFEDMLLHSKEFGFRIQAFHHALSAWKVPELIKESGENITIATFSTFGLYKKEAYDSNLWAGKILADHGVPVAYKSDHGSQELNAKYLMFQAATAHSFHLPEDLALQSVTSVPAKSLELDHRIGFVRPGYDADIVVWDSHPLSVGATPWQVFIDGRATLDAEKVAESSSQIVAERRTSQATPKMRTILAAAAKKDICQNFQEGKTVITGIKKSYLTSTQKLSSTSEDLTMIVESGKVVCFGPTVDCVSQSSGGRTLAVENGHVLPGLTAVTASLGLVEIAMEGNTGDGSVSNKLSPLDPENIVYAKYGIHLDGKAFDRAKITGVTRAISAPTNGGFLKGVSVGFKTHGQKTILNGGIFRDDVALHFGLGQESKKSESTPTISSAVTTLKTLLIGNKGKDNTFGRAVNGSLPLVVHTENKYDILQLIKIKQEFESINLVIFGGSGAPAVATELAAAKIPIILTGARPAPDAWEKRDVLVGPPLSRSPAAILSEAGVKFGLATGGEEGDSHIINLPLEAAWAAKYAGLSGDAAVDLVSRNIEEILGLDVKEETRDFVVFQGNPLEFGASVVIAVNGDDGKMMACWPESN